MILRSSVFLNTKGSGAVRPQPSLSSLTTLAFVGGALLVLIGVQYLLHLRVTQGEGAEVFFPRFTAIWCIEGALFLFAVRVIARPMPPGALPLILAFAVILRVIPLAAPAFLSTDLYRYVWDGRVGDAGVNPYCCIPSAPELERLREPLIYPNINRADYAPTIYPPAAQMLFEAVARVSQTPFAMKLAMMMCEVVSWASLVFLLGRAGLPRERVLIYAWHPLAIWEYAGNAHVDAAAIAWIAVALVLAASRNGWVRAAAGIALAGATLTKFLPAVITPAFWRRDLRLPLVFLLAVMAAYACYASAGSKVLGFLFGYGREEGLSGGVGIYWLRLLGHLVTLPQWAGHAWLGLGAIVIAGLALAVTLRAPAANNPADTAAHALVLATAVIVTLTPHYAWYFGWLAFLACLAPWSSVLWLTTASVVLYFDSVHDRIGWESVLYLPFVVLAVRDAARGALVAGRNP
jgi:hypothetical protein